MSRFRLVCAGCGTPAPPRNEDPYAFRCRNATAAPDTDHVVAKILSGDFPRWPSGSTEPNPFVRYRHLLYSYEEAREEEFCQIVKTLDDRIFEVCGRRFQVTACAQQAALAAALGFSDGGGVWVKDETSNVSGSHKGRHLAGIMLYLLSQTLKFVPNQFPDLAIASCGNAALAAAVVARAAGWPLRAFVPPDASSAVRDRLRTLGAAIIPCPRQAGEAGDPCYHRFHEAIAAGALPFCCQGPDNGLTIEGGETLAYEMVDQLAGHDLDAIVIQVGGGALASACVQGFERAVALGALTRMPRIYTVQTQGAAPLARAFERAAARASQDGIGEALGYAATHRSEFMWPWEQEPRSVAHGILDDETYDWLAVVKGMIQTDGAPVIVGEAALHEANHLAREATRIDVDHTGSAGLAGLMALRASGEVRPDENVAVIFSGVRRAGGR